MTEVHSLFAKEKETLRAMKGPQRHPRYGGTFTSYNQHNPNNISLMRNAPKRAALPALAPQKPKTKLIVSQRGEGVYVIMHWICQRDGDEGSNLLG